MLRDRHFCTPSLLLIALLHGASLALLAPAQARAEEFASIPTNVALIGDNVPEKILIYREDQCLAALRPIFEPEAMIIKGLTALSAGPEASSAAACLDEIVGNYATLIPLTPTPAYDPPPPAEIQAKLREYDEVVEKIGCANPFDPGSDFAKSWAAGHGASECKGEITPAAALPALHKKRISLDNELRIQRAEEQMNANLTDLKDLLLPVEKNPEIDVLLENRKCFSPASPLPDKCEGKALTKAEADALSFKINLMINEDYQKQMKSEGESSALGRLLNDRAEREKYLDLAKLRALNQKLICQRIATTIPYPGYREYCESKAYPTEGNPAELAAEAKALFPNVRDVIQQYKKDAPRRELAENARASAKQNEIAHRYALRRLLAHHSAFQRGKPSAPLKDFCADNEAKQLEERELSEKLGLPLAPFYTRQHWAWAAKYGMPESALTAVRTYTGSYYREINARIWKSKAKEDAVPLDAHSQLYIKTLNQTLEIAPPYEGKPVRRFSALPPEQLAAHQVGKVIVYDGFTSTSKKEDWQWSPGIDANHFFLIYGGKNGMDIQALSKNPKEEEVLFKAGTRFKVLSREPRKGASPGSFNFVMAEVDEAGNVIADLPKGGANALE